MEKAEASLHGIHTGNQLLFFFARPRLLAGRGCGVTVFPDSVPLRGLALGRFHDACSGRSGRVLDAACDPGTRPLHFDLAWVPLSQVQNQNF